MIGEQQERAALRGHPSYVWRFGQDRRLALVRTYVPLEGQRILDIGCGIGTYVRKFGELGNRVWGIDVEFHRVREGSKSVPNLAVARGESLPFRDASFDVVFLHEVLEHVHDDAQTVQEAYRVISPGGYIVIFAPNRLYFFETHGFYLGKKFVLMLLPLVNWLPHLLRRILVPHVRAYFYGDLKCLWRGLAVQEVAHSYVYPGFDNIAARWPVLGRLLRRICYFCEHTPLRVFGLSHFLVLQRVKG